MTKVELIPITAALQKALEHGPETVEARHGARLDEEVEALVREVVAQSLDLMARVPRRAPWGCYLARDANTRKLVGTCGFKAGPDADQAVEIAYYTFPPYEGHGFATAMAKALMEIAASSPQVRRVIAHAIVEEGAPTRVLEKLGMHYAGPVKDAEEHTVGLWEEAEEGTIGLWEVRPYPPSD
jgi:ribosomal-protein-alanine N-acetyltransferase